MLFASNLKVTSYLKVSVPPNQGCFTYARDEHLCFCNTDLCNTRPFIASIFNGYREAVRRGNEAKRTELIG
ncbi:unnamed protein product [Anisakis simplex]|uniref:Protein quiver n=1 Tax=Anisakis simplex TaxID=6269 RepID=A0A0M3JAP5_ANISI|nr:unnamed protein product [Anisakis simplex]